MPEANSHGRIKAVGGNPWSDFISRTALMLFASINLMSIHQFGAEASDSKVPAAVRAADSKQLTIDAGVLNKLEEAVEKDNFFEADEILKSIPEGNVVREPRLLVVKAMIAKGLYRLDEAYKFLKLALKINRNFAPAQYEIALILMERKVWRDAEVLLRIAAASDSLQGQRRIMLPYYLGVIAFETGRLFEARTSFLRLNWNESLDPAIEQSMTNFVSRISKQRPWSVILPLSLQYDSNLIALPDSAALPAAYSRQQGMKMIAGVFGQLEGIALGQNSAAPFGLGMRFFAVRHFEQTFRSLDVQFVESELNWSRLINPEWGVLKLAASANFVRANERPLSSTFAMRGNFKNTELMIGYEGDLQKNQGADKTSTLVRVAREQLIANRGAFSFGLPAEMGAKIPLAETPSESRIDFALTPTIGFAPFKRWNLKTTEKLRVEHVKSKLQPAGFLVQSSSGFNFSLSVQPYFVTSAGASFEWEKNLQSNEIVKKTTASISLLGIL